MSLPRLVCACPDFQKKADRNPSSPYLYEQIDRDWSDSNAGVNPGEWCKHCWALAIAEGLLDQVELPKDLAIPKAPQPTLRAYPSRLQAISSRGDYFGV